MQSEIICMFLSALHSLFSITELRQLSASQNEQCEPTIFTQILSLMLHTIMGLAHLSLAMSLNSYFIPR